MIGNENIIKASRWTCILLVLIALCTIDAGPAHADLSCSACHTMPPLDSVAGEREPSSGAFRGNHQGHSSNSVDSCVPCHGAEVTSYEANHSAPPPGSGSKPIIRLTPALNNYSIGSTGTQRATYSRGTFFNQTSVPPSPLGTCSNVNCHFEVTTPAWGTPNFTLPTDCDKCHGAPPSAIDPGSHTKHNTYYPGVTNCQKCHPNNTTFQHATSAGNRPLGISFAASPNNGSGVYTGPLNDYLPSQTNAFGNCTATYCHSPGNKNSGFDAPKQVAAWGSGTLGCGGCHDASPVTGSHYTHTFNFSIACYKCHASTVKTLNAISSTAKHVNKKVDITFNNTTTAINGKYNSLTSPMQKTPGTASASCENVYCHSNGQGTGGTWPPTYSTPVWGNYATGNCGTCHDHGYHAGTINKLGSGSHTKHMQYTFSAVDNCAVCHYGGGGVSPSCNQCHDPGPTGFSETFSRLHVNGQVDVGIVTKFSGTYNGTLKPGDGYGACSSSYCHSNGLASSPTYYTPTWGNVASGACGTCHGVTAAAPPASTPHIEHVGSANPYLFACDACHNGKVSVTANSTIQPAHANFTSHVNKLRDVKFNSGSPFGTYSSANQSCRNLYCHSTGNLNVSAGALPAVYNGNKYTRQTWSGSLACNGCHGRSTSNGMPDYTNGGVATTTANSHAKHVSSSAIACVQCHEKTTKSGTAIRSTVPSKHVDATTKDVFFNLTGLNASGSYNTTRQRCYSTYCHSDGTKASGPFVPYSSAAWGASLTCAGCHKADIASGNTFTTNSHVGHINKFGGQYTTIKCVKCHAVTAKADMSIAPGSRHTNSQIEIAFDSSSSAANGSYIGTPATPASPMTKAPGSAKGTCTNIYCHSSGQGDNGSWPPTYYTTPAWGTSDMQFCGKCHGFPFVHGGSFGTSTPLTTGSHVKHLKYQMNVTYRDYERCVACHAYNRTGFDPLSCNASLCHGAGYMKHSNYEINVGIPVFYGASAAFNGTTKPGHDGAGYTNSTCSLVYCHSNGLATSPTYVTPKWGDTATGACGTCHGANATVPPASINHSKHVGSSSPYQYACALCHAGIVKHNANSTTYALISTATTIGAFDGSKLHVNKTRNVKFDSMNTGATYTSGTQTCNTSYCHSLGNINVTNTPPLPAAYSGSIYAAPIWTGSLGCNGCHGRSTEDGEPDYTNGGPGATTANSHSKHLSLGDISCSECHRSTTINGTTIRTDLFPSSHVNTVTNDIFFNLSGTLSNNGVYTKATKTCTTVACHSNGRGTYKSAQWGVTDNCDYCHPITDLGGAHAKHVDLTQTVSFYTYTANRSTSSGHNFGCSNCHPMSTENSHPILPIMIDFRPAVGGVGMLRSKNSAAITAYGPVGTANSGTTADSVTNSVVKCLNVYCHSNGYALNTVFATTPNWYGGTFSGDKCANCHGNSPNSTIVGSAAHYSTNFMGQGVTDGHLVGIHYDTIFTGTDGLAPVGSSNVSGHGNATTATTMGCNLCHNATVAITNNDKNTVCASCHNGTQAALRSDSAISNKSNHVNGMADVVFNPIKIRSKAQMLNAAVITPYSSVWTRNNGYKNAGSYDEAKVALDTATMWDSATKTCSNVSCHNNQPVKWGSTNGTTSCQRCHPNM